MTCPFHAYLPNEIYITRAGNPEEKSRKGFFFASTKSEKMHSKERKNFSTGEPDIHLRYTFCFNLDFL